MTVLADKIVLQIFVDAIDDRWKDPHSKKPKQLTIPYELAKKALLDNTGD